VLPVAAQPAVSVLPVSDETAAGAAQPPAAVPFLTEAQMREQQRANLIAALRAANWKISGKNGAADRLGMRPTTLTDRMRALQIKRPARGS
jgi:transcriptional regulator with GAF, ATPase, and Fis domain